jgi:hypothetical protein
MSCTASRPWCLHGGSGTALLFLVFVVGELTVVAYVFNNYYKATVHHSQNNSG